MNIEPIARFRSCYPEKFGVPRQPGLVPEAVGEVVLVAPYAVAEAVRGLEKFSHLWLVFGFHKCTESGWQPTVRPPRLGGNERVGVFASRSPFRPNGLGLSVVRVVELHSAKGVIVVAGHDLVDDTPIYDIKPYIPYSDAVKDAACGYAPSPESALATAGFRYEPEAKEALAGCELRWPGFRALLENTIRQDPRPAYQSDADRSYGLGIYDANIRWKVAGGTISVLEILG